MKKRNFRAPSGETISFTELGFGTAPIGNLYRAVDPEEAQRTLDAAWKAGIRYYDTAPLYGLGLSETRLNRFLFGKKRKDYVLSTKVGRLLEVCDPKQRTGIGKFFDTPSRREIYDYSYDGFMRSIEFSLERLGVDSIDVIFIHDVDVFNHKTVAARDAHVKTILNSGIKALEKLRSEKVIKAFGAGVNEWEVCEILTRNSDVDIFLLAGRYTLLEQDSLNSFLPLCEERGIGIVLGGPYNSGILATGPKPGAWYNYDPAPKAILERVAKIEAVCKRHKVKLAQAALRFPLHHRNVVSVIPGGVSPKEVALNVATMDAKLPKTLWKDLKAEGLLHADAPVPR
ncbi:aldo/keto reductase [Aestuariivirga litoralis]|uniref:Aldo/keto reductase n=1 Tax=Aestuariivirga litoralis TaxID=2650924 RepID=A0A2W2AQ00_9HYPH|nr:aldo/keto reductase [Aestuariivirga litoralis]PZF77491.1 aldo/keto reductase [Aestuariivirga litoralis]